MRKTVAEDQLACKVHCVRYKSFPNHTGLVATALDHKLNQERIWTSDHDINFNKSAQLTERTNDPEFQADIVEWNHLASNVTLGWFRRICSDFSCNYSTVCLNCRHHVIVIAVEIAFHCGFTPAQVAEQHPESPATYVLDVVNKAKAINVSQVQWSVTCLWILSHGAISCLESVSWQKQLASAASFVAVVTTIPKIADWIFPYENLLRMDNLLCMDFQSPSSF